MRLKNVKGAKEKISQSSYVILDPRQHRGKIAQLFENQNPIYIEIGMGKGNFIIENAKRYPHINFIGIEKYDSVLVRAIEKLEGIELSNLKLIRMDATEIEEVFDHEVDTIYLNFSDPWPKARHSDRRLTSTKFLKRYDSIFVGTPHIVMKTDNMGLFEFSLQSFSQYGYVIEEISLDLYQSLKTDNIPTEYELKFHGRGLPIYFCDVRKK